MKKVMLGLLVTCTFISIAGADDINVSSASIDSISAAYASAIAGDVLVLTDAGPYSETGYFAWAKDVDLRAADGVNPVINATMDSGFLNPMTDGIKYGDNAYGTITITYSKGSWATIDTWNLGAGNTVTLENIVFEGGNGEYCAGYFRGGTVVVNNCTFNGSGASAYSMWIWSGGSDVDITFNECTITNCTYGANIYNGNTTTTLNDCVVSNSGYTGLLVNASGAGGNVLNVNRTIFSNNFYYDVQLSHETTCNVSRSVVTAQYGLTIDTTAGSTLTVDHCDFLGAYYGVYKAVEADVTVTNSILCDAWCLGDASGGAGTFVSDYNCAWGGAGTGYSSVTPGANDLADVDPLYTNPPTGWDSTYPVDCSSLVWPDDLIPQEPQVVNGSNDGVAIGSTGILAVRDWNKY